MSGAPSLTKDRLKTQRQRRRANDALLASSIVAMRAKEASWEEISSAVGKFPTACRGMFYWALKFTLGDTRQLHHMREIETETLRMMQHGLMKRALKGDVEAIREVRGLMERRAKMLGLDMPTKIAPTDPSGDKPASTMQPRLDFEKLNRAERAQLRQLIVLASDS